MSRFFTNLMIATVAVAVAILAYRAMADSDKVYNVFDLFRGQAPTVATTPTPTLRGEPVMDVNSFAVLSQVNSALADLTESVVPSVVSIDTKRTVNRRRYVPADPFGLSWRSLNERAEIPAGLGSGAIVSEDGYIVTNHHVVSDVSEIMVTLHGGKSYEAEWIGSDPRADVAVLKIIQPEGEPVVRFKPLPFGDSNQVRVGEMALAIGNPFGLSETVTRGIISAKQRQLSDNTNEYFQVDAVINPGNSGGPLVNIRGEIIGVNVAIFTGDQNVKAWQGVGLAIPANEAREIYEAIALDKPLERGYLGVGLASRAPVVVDVAVDSPAALSGLQPGDQIVKFDGKKIASSEDFISRIRKKKGGDVAKIELLRDGKVLKVEPQFVSKSAMNSLTFKKDMASKSGFEIAQALGIQVQNLTAQERQVMNIPEDVPAILISDVQRGSQAAAQFKPGDLIHIINRNRVSNVATFYDLLGSLPQNKRSMMILSRDGERFAAALNP